MRKIGILGGTFNPPHLGHLIIAEHVRDELALEEIWFVPTYISPHKEKLNISVKHRLNMLRKAIEGNKYFFINEIEINRAGTSYTIDTITSLTKQYPNDEFYFIIGADMVEYLPNWKRIEELISLVTFVGVNRRHHSLSSRYPVKNVDVPLIDISSTEIRARIKQNKSIKYLVPNNVQQYIEENRLYGD